MTVPVPIDDIDFTTAALAYASRGWRVLPCFPGEKRPSLSSWPTLASTEVPTICDWWIGAPHANIGLATGRASGFFVLDIDPKHGGDDALAQLEDSHGELPPTYTVRTGSGGSHFYFACPDDFEVTNSPGQLKGSGIDVRGEGGQVLAPPSVTAIGAYSVELEAAIVPAPPWLLELIRPRALAVVGGTSVDPLEGDEVGAYVRRALAAAVDTVAQPIAGSRKQVLNDQVLALAGIAAHDAALLDRDEVFGLMIGACGDNGLLREDGYATCSATFESAWTAGLERPREQWPPVDRNAGLYFGAVPQVTSTLPTVQVTSRKHNEVTDEVLTNLGAANAAEPRLFAHGSEMVQVVGQPARTSVIDGPLLSYEADVAMHFVKRLPNGGTAVANVPLKVVETIVSMPSKPFPHLTRISYTPFFSPSGRLVTEPGYDAESQTFYAPALGVTVPEVPADPSFEQVTAARDFVVTNVMGDFPFVADADRAHAVALTLLPFVRDLIDGPTPLHDIEAPTPGSGKGLLMKALLSPGVGGRHVTVGAASENAEWEKRLVSFLRLTPQALVIDNVNERLDSGFLCTALTEPEVTSRVLGASTQVSIPVRTTWVMTANNPKLSDEVARRTLRIRLDPQVERPEDRSGFRHPDLAAWCHLHRGALIAALCTMAQGWVRAGMPELVPDRPLGSFERWHAVMGGLLEYLEVPGLLQNKAEFLAVADDEGDAWSALVGMLRSNIDRNEWTSAELADIIVRGGLAIDLGHREGSRALVMGRQLGKQRDRWHAGYRFESRRINGLTQWRLQGRLDL